MNRTVKPWNFLALDSTHGTSKGEVQQEPAVGGKQKTTGGKKGIRDKDAVSNNTYKQLYGN